MQKRFNYLSKIERKRNPNFSRHDKIRLEKNERVSKFNKKFLNKIQSRFKSEHLTAYPEVENLYKKISSQLKIKKEMIVITAGSDLAIKNCFELLVSPEDQVITINPTYGMVDVYTKLFGAKQVKINFDKSLKLNVNEICKKINKKTNLIVLANPNSPTGTVISKKDIIKILKISKKNNAYVLIDECYYGYYKKTVLSLIKKHKNLIISRSFSKIGLAGCRIGFLISNEKVAKLLYKFRPFYEISAFSALVLDEFLNSKTLIKNYVNETLIGKKILTKKLKKLKINFFPTNTNFLLIKLNTNRIRDQIIKYLVKRNFLVLGESKLLGGDKIIRITLGPAQYMRNLSSNIENFFKKQLYYE